MAERSFFLGGLVDPSTGERTGELLEYDPADLTTHGVIVGMTGSGKTGLGVGLIEEAMLAGIPCLVIDPKGDMGNLALTFPGLAPSDFRPWIDESTAVREGVAPDEVAARTAEAWRAGLEGWGLGPDQIRALRGSSPVTVYTPGSSAGVPVNIVGSLASPPIGWEGNEEVLRDEIEGFVSSLLGMAGIDTDPVSDPRHVLVANIIEHAWSAGRDLDLAGLIAAVIDPPFRKLGVFDVDVFFPREDRTELAMLLNGLVASPSFAAWMEGAPLDVQSLLFEGDRPRTAVMYLAHLSDAERQFVVTLLLSKVVSWMRRQQGTGALRAMIYMDEVFGFAPPTAEPPSKKPILTILKQARAFGVGMVISTQNPVDLDYKAMSNAGTWMVGRLQTERDKARILEGIDSATGGVDVSTIDALVSGLDKRTFVLHSTRLDAPLVFTTRWVMSYLAGPLTRDQISRLTPDRSPGEARPAAVDDAARDETVVAPPVADGIGVVWTAPSAPWIESVGGRPGSKRLAPAAVATVQLRYDDRYAEVDHTEEYEAVIHPLDAAASHLTAVDHDARDFVTAPPDGARYALDGGDIGQPSFWRSLASALADRLTGERSILVHKNPALGIYSRVVESRQEFEARCRTEAEARADEEIAKLEERYRTRLRSAASAIRSAESRVRELEADVESRRAQEMVSGAGDLLGALLGGRRGSTGLRRAANRRAQTRRTEERLETAVDKLAAERDELRAIEDDLATDITEITDRWDRGAAEVEDVEIPLERSDVDVAPLRLVWLPVA